MSLGPLNWVKHTERTVSGNDRVQLLMLADEADDNGCCVIKIALLAECCVVDRTTIIDGQKRLEAAGLLLVLRPKKYGRGHYNRYVVVMGRNPYELAADLGWPEPVLSPSVACRWSRPAVTERERGLTEAGAVLPIKGSETPTFSSDDPATDPDSDWWVGHPFTDDGRVGRPPPKGRQKVAKWSPKGRPRPDLSRIPYPEKELASSGRANAPKNPTVPAGETSPAAQAEPGGDAATDDERIMSLASALAGHALQPSWDLSPQQRVTIAAEIDRVGIPALVSHALASVNHCGQPPRRAAAWVAGWQTLVPAPTNQPPCRHGRAVQACPECSGRIPGFFD